MCDQLRTYPRSSTSYGKTASKVAKLAPHILRPCYSQPSDIIPSQWKKTRSLSYRNYVESGGVLNGKWHLAWDDIERMEDLGIVENTQQATQDRKLAPLSQIMDVDNLKLRFLSYLEVIICRIIMKQYVAAVRVPGSSRLYVITLHPYLGLVEAPVSAMTILTNMKRGDKLLSPPGIVKSIHTELPQEKFLSERSPRVDPDRLSLLSLYSVWSESPSRYSSLAASVPIPGTST
ncbi:uncharacterized protein BCR38DRAFT_513949 [Pseudomassariella vexata]|uniref:Uncharacterized protein n=1 Tax=Pseudomassariella vexata TaxID=1141098 RepID=A0A1Y2E1G8_9PEZI|nr:uncharacterized protein BCR38DRAFT_513949 [Pseudomassariella vexata]ORY65372.1 hypothetical protein BCR38DRAFT_513949 [Pseudomassariella vexata]